ncbi:MAG: hypothetical protein AB7U20_15080 [Planctomycetaceae bacterium]
MKRFAITCAAVMGLMLAGSTAANAGGVHVQIGGYGGFGRSGYYGGHGIYSGQRIYGGYGYGYRNPVIWHDTSHFDYHPGQYVPHGNHFHYQPGHYDFHQTGHFDTVHGNHVHHHGH